MKRTASLVLALSIISFTSASAQATNQTAGCDQAYVSAIKQQLTRLEGSPDIDSSSTCASDPTSKVLVMESYTFSTRSPNKSLEQSVYFEVRNGTVILLTLIRQTASKTKDSLSITATVWLNKAFLETGFGSLESEHRMINEATIDKTFTLSSTLIREAVFKRVR